MQASADKIWQAAQQLLRTTLNPDIYNLWFHPVKALALEADTLSLEVADDFCEVWLKDNYLGLIRDVLSTVSGQTLKVKFRVNNASSPMIPALDAKAKAKVAVEVAERASN